MDRSKNRFLRLWTKPGRRRVLNFLLLFSIFISSEFTVTSQINYASSVTSESHVTSSSHSIDGNQSTYSELEAGTGIIIGIGSYSSHIEMQFPTVIPANQTSYVRIETQDNILSSLLGGTLGNLLSGIVGIALTGNQEFAVEAKNGSTVVLSGNSTNPSSFSGERLKVVIDENNHTYLAITPSQPYQSIRIANFAGSLVGLGMKKRMKVWDPYYVIQGTNCSAPKFTSYDAAGITLELLNLGGGVHNLDRAIDGNLVSHSTLSLGVVSVASNITQRAYFEGLSQPTDVFAIRLGIDPALLAITLGQGIRIKTQNGAVLVTNDILQNLLTPANITAIQSGNPVTIMITPTVPVDRVVVEMNGLLGVTVSQSLEIFEVYRISQPPVLNLNSSNLTVCEGTAASLTADAVNPADEIRWYTSTTAATPVTITPSGGVFTTGLLYNDTTFYAASGIPGCPNESVRIPVSVQVIQGPDPSTISIPVLPEYCAADSVILVAGSTNGENYQWYLAQDSTTALVSGQQVGNHTFIINNDSIIIHGLSVADSPFSIYVSVQDSVTGCWSTSGEYLETVITIIDGPTPTTTSALQEFCLSDVPTVDDIDVTEPGVVWYDSATGGTAHASTDTLTSGTYYGSLISAAGCESSVRLEVDVVINDTTAPTTTSNHQYFCLEDTATIADLDVTGGVINWYDENGNSLTTSTVLIDGGTYYATNQGSECESSASLQITVTISDLPAPTTSQTTQIFCEANTPTIADIDVNESSLVWYDENGNVLPSSTALTDSTTYYAALISTNCQSDDRLEILVVFENPYNLTLNGSVDHVCLHDTVLYSVSPGMSDYQWTITGGTIVSGGTSSDNTISVVWLDSVGTSIEITYINTGNCLIQTEHPIIVTTIGCSELSITKTVNNLHPVIGEEIIFTITVGNEGQAGVSDVIVNEVIQNGFTYVSHQASIGSYDLNNGEWTIPYLNGGETAVLTIRVKVNPTGNYSNVATIGSIGGNVTIDPDDNSSEVVVEPSCLNVYNEISPNSDGVNDYFYIDCIEQYPGNSLTVYNRYGNVVYSTNGYKNDWDGTANVSGVIGKGEQLPVGTYYYLLKIDEKEFESTGWIYIVR